MHTGTLWRAALLLSAVGLFGCPKSNEPGSDCPPATPEGACYDDCCGYLGEPTRTASCGFECRTGRLIDRCAPTAACIDGGMPPLCDAGLPFCVGGSCCDQERPAIPGAACSFTCPAGFDFTCEPDPAAFCESFDAPCTEPTECTLAIDTCCGPCGVPTLDDFDPILVSRADDHRAAVCPDPSVICPACPVAPNPNLGATCTANRCTAFDVRTIPLSACTSHDDCRLRVRECCACGGDTSPFSLIAIRADSEAAYQALVCGSEIACPECEPTYPSDVSAYCADDGHCAVRTGI